MSDREIRSKDDTGVRLMRATKAYIASLGTTGVLLAGSLLMLAVVSAVVAFDRWPGGNVTAPVQTVALDDKPAAIRVSESSTAPSAVPSAARVAAALRSTANAGPRAVVRTPALGNVLGVRVRGTAPTTPAAAPVQKTVQNVQQTTYPLFEAVSNPGTTAGQIADGVQTVTDATGTGLNAVSPDLGTTVTQAGQSASDALKSVPLPGHVLPGH